MRPTFYIRIFPLVVGAFVTVTASRSHASSCSVACVRRMAECRAERCAGLSAKRCRARCRAVTGCRSGGARIRTLATVVNECKVVNGSWTYNERLDIKRGDCAPETVMALASDSVPDTTPESICERYGRFRDGTTAVTVGAFQRLGVSPNGETVLFEVNTHVREPSIPAPTFAVREEGIFAVRRDGTVRHLGPPSREKAYRYGERPGLGISAPFVPTFTYFSFSPSGRYVAFSDRGPGADGSDAAQVVVMNLDSRKRTQVTSFRAAGQGSTLGPDAYGVFLDEDTVGVFGLGEGFFTVRRDGTMLRPIDVSPIASGGGSIVGTFRVAGPFGTTVGVGFPRMRATEPIADAVVELFVYSPPDRLLQLTRFGRSDTRPGPSLNTGNRVFFVASADPFDANPNNACQLFSIDRLGAGLRQLTRFTPSASSSFGCIGGGESPLECGAAITSPPQFDARTGTLVFDGTCDQSGLHPVSSQVFAMRRDGSGFRQLTNYGGLQGTAAEGTLSVELPGPIEYSGLKN